MTTSPYQAIIFDFDDTLVRTFEVKWAHHKAVAKEFYGRELTDETLAKYWGMPFDTMVGLLHNHSDTTENLRAAYAATDHRFLKTTQPGAPMAVSQLHQRGYTLGIITAMNREPIVAELAPLGFSPGAFLFIQGSDDTTVHKPDPAVFSPALSLLSKRGIKSPQILYIGDALSDFQAASDAGLHFLGVTTGRTTHEEFKLAGAKSFSTLAPIIEQLLAS